jgi:aldehyde:ferredoxin oxidoreductase
MIALREGIGNTLARGIRYAAKQWDMEDVAVHVKGLEPPGYDPRVLKGCGLGYAVSDRGACHLRATFHRPELNGTSKMETLSGKAAILIEYEDRLSFMDSLILCRFYRDMYPWDKLAHIVHLTTGLPENSGILKERIAGIAALVRQFNVREGMTPADDHLSPRLYKEKLKTGHEISREDMEGMLQEYYTLRGWSITGQSLSHTYVSDL